MRKKKQKDSHDHLQVALDEYSTEDKPVTTLAMSTGRPQVETGGSSQAQQERPSSSRSDRARVAVKRGVWTPIIHTPTQRQTKPRSSLPDPMMEMSRIATALGLTKETRDLAFKIFRKAKRRGIARGQSVFALVGASAYAACRTSGDARELTLFAVQLRIPEKALARMYGILSESIGGTITIPDPVRIVERIGMVKKIPENVVESAKKVVVSARQRGLSVGNDPRGLAGAALYICSVLAGYPLTERDVATAARVTEVTIKNRCKELTRVLGLALPLSD